MVSARSAETRILKLDSKALLGLNLRALETNAMPAETTGADYALTMITELRRYGVFSAITAT